ncbi:hypothetical protein LZD49_12520 [Dyadobacter sp. CY261]|uniref:hypothetical protein n=1 Tax=Dyadobacter sp. CY261 TaxID=2907203 RepID=UPI001F212CD6|nr:hypothetical protein [Dyadobacter sp. CY261]MCF0071297.1 hypothetical protein [Dyadobacter sp. CY261]
MRSSFMEVGRRMSSGNISSGCENWTKIDCLRIRTRTGEQLTKPMCLIVQPLRRRSNYFRFDKMFRPLSVNSMYVEKARAGRRIKHSIPVSLPVKNYLQKWYPDHYQINQSEYLGMWLINAMVKKTSWTRSYSDSSADLDSLKEAKLTESWCFNAPVRYQYQIVLPKRRVIEFHNMIMKFMYGEIFFEMEVRRLKGEVDYIQTSIDEFRDRYGIWDKYLMDETIRKAYMRWKKRSDITQAAFVDFFPGKLLGKI